MDKSLALWRMKSSGHGSCAAQAEEVVRLNPAGAPIFSLAAERAALGTPSLFLVLWSAVPRLPSLPGLPSSA